MDPNGVPTRPAEPLPGSYWEAPKPPPPGRWASRFRRLAIGLVVTFIGGSLLYGPQNVVMGLAFAVICTLGISLIVILPLLWAIGFVAEAVWGALQPRRSSAAP